MQFSIRRWRESDTQQLFELFQQTVRQVNSRDYSGQQIAAWASDSLTLTDWQSRMLAIQPFVACCDGLIVGYADLQSDGLIDHFFVHHGWQGRGVGSALMQHIHQQASVRSLSRLHAHVSKTARPFFEHWAFDLVAEQEVEIRGAVLTNYLMQKSLTP